MYPYHSYGPKITFFPRIWMWCTCLSNFAVDFFPVLTDVFWLTTSAEQFLLYQRQLCVLLFLVSCIFSEFLTGGNRSYVLNKQQEKSIILYPLSSVLKIIKSKCNQNHSRLSVQVSWYITVSHGGAVHAAACIVWFWKEEWSQVCWENCLLYREYFWGYL